MDEPGLAWPAWKFGMKRDDLFTKLHDQYNTFASSIQDPDAFHHDVCEISHEASTTQEFHRLMSERKQQRLRELNYSLESAAIEIIANPKLIGTEQWQYALQLFRTKSLDSLIRYFASYLPDDYLNSQGYQTASSTASSFTDSCSVNTVSTTSSSTDDADHPSFFDHDDKPLFTHEPPSLVTDFASLDNDDLLSPRSMTAHSEIDGSPDDDLHRHYNHHPPTPARTLSFSGSESDAFGLGSSHLLRQDMQNSSRLEDPGTPATSISDVSDNQSTDDYKLNDDPVVVDDDEFPPAQFPTDSWDVMESETPTPRQEPPYLSYLDSKTLCSHGVPSPHRTPPPRLRRRDASPSHLKRTPEESLSRIQKPLPDGARIRPKGRRRRHEC